METSVNITHKDMFEEKKQHIKDLTKVMSRTLGAALQGIKDREMLIERIRCYLKNVRYGKKGYQYFFVYDCTVNIYHVRTQLQGSDLSDMQDINGKYILREACRIVENGGGFLEYIWAKPNVGDILKVGYFEAIPGTPFWVGTGVFFDEIEKKKDRLKKEIDRINEKNFSFTIGLFGLLFIVILIMFCLWIIEIKQFKSRYRKIKKTL